MATKKKTEKQDALAVVPSPVPVPVPVPVMMKLGIINEAPYNPRIMTRERMASLKASLAKHGMVLNLVVQKRSKEFKLDNVLIGGHQRLKALRELAAESGWSLPLELSAVVLDVDDATAKQLNVSLNKIEGEFDPYKLGEMFSGIIGSMTTEDVLASGFTADQIRETTQLVLPPEEQIEAIEQEIASLPPEFDKRPSYALEFATKEARDLFKDLVKEAAERQKKLPGDAAIVAVKAWSALAPAKKKK